MANLISATRVYIKPASFKISFNSLSRTVWIVRASEMAFAFFYYMLGLITWVTFHYQTAFNNTTLFGGMSASIHRKSNNFGWFWNWFHGFDDFYGGGGGGGKLAPFFIRGHPIDTFSYTGEGRLKFSLKDLNKENVIAMEWIGIGQSELGQKGQRRVVSMLNSLYNLLLSFLHAT